MNFIIFASVQGIREFSGCGKNFRAQKAPFFVKTMRFVDDTPPAVLREDDNKLPYS